MKLVLNKRESKGKNKVDKLRANGEVPGVLYSKGNEAKLLSGLEKDLLKAFSDEGYSNIFEIEVDGEPTSVLFKEVQMHHIKNAMVHFDLYEVDMNTELTVEVMQIGETKTIADLDIFGDENIKIEHLEADEAVATLVEPTEEKEPEEGAEEASAEVPTVSETEAKEETEE